ncbi:EAL domain-containing protein [Duganella sp. FT92W]|uniref:EAL domain-containing protein n=1 Tax=Pseudoduganella rivuli TaxID=2666085 RepID=A0A7X2IPC4_9BURK|nr:EAL domain-containing protein [Pseudoduganella rivuli]MRV73526.1 EAL domain-containing protein [Pseudoduganella rivuli]
MISQAELSGAKILIVDDHPFNVAVLAAMLQMAGYTDVTSTMDPREVCAMHRAHDYDLILLDINMPFMDGFAVMEHLKQIDADTYLPILALTAAPEYKLRALAEGARDFVAKPFDHSEVLSRIRNMLEVRLLYKGSCHHGQRVENYDALTGLPNRTLFQRALEHTLAAEQRQGVLHLSAVLLADLDGFSRVNDTLGQAAGDEVLRQAARRLQQCAPAAGSLARIGNDEFALLVSALDTPATAMAVAEKIRTACAEPFAVDGGEVCLTASVGIALHPGDAGDAATLVRHAGVALHQARMAGVNSCRWFTESMNTKVQQRFEFENALRKAHSQREFELYYQPKLDIGSGRVAGVEALLRWNRPGCGLVSPGEFIPVLEETGLIVAVGAWVIDEACRQAALWKEAAGQPFHIAVNVASRQFAEGNLEDIVRQALLAHDIPPAMLSLEVTESAVMADTERAADMLAALRRLGVQVAIDDFGTGYSSLAYLKRLPVDTLKIDIAFIREVTRNPGDAALVDAIIAMAHSLGLDVVAEGVETAEQLAYLGRRRCDQIQGYYFSRPLPAAQCAALLGNQSAMAAEAAPGVPQRTLLIIDDEPHVLSALQRLLRPDGYRILTAQCAADAFSLLAQHPVQLVMCDQRMDGMSGTEILDRVKDMYPDTFRIILSGYTDLATIMESINRGSLYRFYTKPWSNQVLRDNIRDAFRDYWQRHGLAPAVGKPAYA